MYPTSLVIRRVSVSVLLVLFVLFMGLPMPAQVEEPVDLDAVHRIKDEGLNRSEVMDLASYLTDVYGPRLTGSPNIRMAGDYARSKLVEWELVNAELEEWGPFGRGWTNDRFSAHLTIMGQSYPVIGYPKAWTPGTNGAVRAEAVLAVIETPEDIEEFRGRLGGKYVLTESMPEVPAMFEAPGRRFTDEELLARSQQPVRARRGRGRNRDDNDFPRTRMEFFLDEGVAALLEPGAGSGGTVFVRNGGRWEVDADPVAPQVELAVEHYGRIYRTLDKGVAVSMEIDIQNTFHDDDLNAFNVVGEISGTDRADEVVMLGAHFDSWHTGTGATDNAAGSAVMMEAVRILKAIGLPMRRTVRIALWTGEEHGFFGSRAFVAEHLADRHTMELDPEHLKFAAYFNLDNGTGSIRGIYAQGNDRVEPIFSRWIEPFRSMGMTTFSIRPTGGTDHIAFDEVGLPGFQFIQDPIEYNSRTHHSSMDVYERIQADDMMKNAVIVASFVYHAANRDALLPRKPLPAPREQED